MTEIHNWCRSVLGHYPWTGIWRSFTKLWIRYPKYHKLRNEVLIENNSILEKKAWNISWKKVPKIWRGKIIRQLEGKCMCIRLVGMKALSWKPTLMNFDDSRNKRKLWKEKLKSWQEVRKSHCYKYFLKKRKVCLEGGESHKGKSNPNSKKDHHLQVRTQENMTPP